MFLPALRKLFSQKSCSPARRPGSRHRLRVEGLEDRWVPATLTVDGDGGKQFTTITAAIAAAHANDTINVYDAAADYTEQLTIPAGKNGLKIIAVQSGVVLKSPTDVTPATVAGTNLGAALIDIRSTNVTIQGLTVNGSDNTDGELSAGIRVVGGGSATIKNNTITGLTTTSDLTFGIGIQIGTSRGTGSAGTAKVHNNTITDYLGAGVLVDGAGANGEIKGNTITGRGAANGELAQYGVQVSRSATARIEQNTISDNTAAGNSAGVLLFEVSGKKNVVAKNTIENNEIGIWLYDTSGSTVARSEVLNNDVTGNGFSGILVDLSNNVTVKNNDVSGNTGDGIGVYDSTGVEVSSNRASGNGADGIYIFGGTSTRLMGNQAFDNGENGIATEDSSNNSLLLNTTWSNGFNGIEILGGSGTYISLSDSHSNEFDGILLQDTTNSTVVGNFLGCNGGYGLRLQNADNILVALNLILNNDEGSIFISADSENVCTIANWIDEPITVEEIGAGAITASWLSSVADSDGAVSELED